jgi:hypothetical protein
MKTDEVLQQCSMQRFCCHKNVAFVTNYKYLVRVQFLFCKKFKTNISIGV